MIGQTLGHFRIVRKIGAGGMGEVYAARDTRLDRDVACKVLPAGSLANDETRARFRREALALGRLNHPNIASVYDFDTQEGIDFLVMEYIDGLSLNDKLEAGPLPEETITHLATQITDGLSAAHEQGVIHRDLKPGNLRVTGDGRLKILDFGLATFVMTGTDDATTERSRANLIVGTLPYMAPEQLRGEVVDQRTDLYALGVVLYEMATGRRPFEHAAAAALATEIQFKTPVPPRDLQPRVSPRLEAVILKCLEKEPAHRYQSATEVGADLRRLPDATAVTTAVADSSGASAAPMALSRRRLWWAAAGALAVIAMIAIGFNVGGVRDQLAGARGGAPIRSVAVLPLENLSGDASQEYFADGMTEALIADLSKIRAVRVISRTSVMQFKRTTSTVPAIARELGVDAVVQGSVQRVGNRVRIRAQLIRAQPEEHLWVNDFDREITDVLDLQRELSAAVASEIRVSLTVQEQARLARARSVRPEVYDAYLRGRYYLGSGAMDGWSSALAYFEEALRLDASYAPAHAGLAEAQVARGFLGAGQPREVLEKARTAAARALELDDSLADAHAAMGWVRTVADWQWAEAEREFRRALDLDPGSAANHSVYSTFLSAVGRHDQAIAEGRIALDLDPLSMQTAINLGWRFQGAGLYDEAIDQYKKVMTMGPAAQIAASNLAEVYALLARLPEARAEMAKLRPLADTMPGVRALLAPTYAAAGMREEARAAIDQANLLREQGVYPSSTRLGLASAFLGDRDRAFAELERAFQERDLWIVFLAWLPKPDWLRADPRYLDLTTRINLPG